MSTSELLVQIEGSVRVLDDPIEELKREGRLAAAARLVSLQATLLRALKHYWQEEREILAHPEREL